MFLKIIMAQKTFLSEKNVNADPEKGYQKQLRFNTNIWGGHYDPRTILWESNFFTVYAILSGR